MDTPAGTPTPETPPVPDPAPAQTPAPTETPAPPTPAHEEAERAAPQSDEDGPVVEGDATEPPPTSHDVGDDPEVSSAPDSLPEESFEADPSDRHGAEDHPES